MYYLKANSEQEIWEALESVDLAYKDYDTEDELNVRPDDMIDDTWQPTGAFTYVFTGTSLDMIGTIYKETGNMISVTSEEGAVVEIPEYVALEGFHANMIGSPNGDLSAIVVDAPKTPNRKFAGDK